MKKIQYSGHFFRDFITSLRRNGVLNTLKIIYSTLQDRKADAELGINSSGGVNVANLSENLPNKKYSALYEPTRARPFSRLMQELALSRSEVFIDVGCGKGRVIALAAKSGFKKIKGIEFSQTLFKSLTKNLLVIKKRYPNATIEVFNKDILNYEIKSEDQIFYLYDPFKKEILEQWLTRLNESYLAHPRKITIIYHNNLTNFQDVFHQTLPIDQQNDITIQGNRTSVYRLHGKLAKPFNQFVLIGNTLDAALLYFKEMANWPSILLPLGLA